MDWFLLAVALPLFALAFGAGACALHWAVKHGQVDQLRDLVRSRFQSADADEPSDPLLAPEPAPAKRAPSQP